VLGVRADSLRDDTVALDGVWSAPAAHRLGVAAEPDDGDVEAALDRFQAQLASMIGDRPDTDPVVVAAVDRIRAGDGRVAGLGGQLGLSDRQLRRRFDQAVGYGPKQLARVVRFQRAWSLATEAAGGGSAVAWATIAAVSGYADQSHLVHDFGDLGGATPTQLLGRAAPGVRFVQATDGDRLVSSQA
jgi:AraC-like DNA-binding protein